MLRTEEDVRRVYMPYCMQKTTDGKYILLNRLYKPLGIVTDEWIDYDTHPTAMPIKGITALRASKLSHDGSASLDCIYFYNDGSIPTWSAADWTAYSKRLQMLAKLNIKWK